MTNTTRRTLTALLAFALALSACGQPEPELAAEIDAYWASIDVVDQSTICTEIDNLGSGFNLIAAASDDDGVIDLLDGGVIEDTHDNRVKVGAALDHLAQEVCP